MNDETKELFKQIKAYRNDMVARNYPFQQISDIITKWEMKELPEKDFLDEAEREKKELEESYKESVRQAKERKEYNEHSRNTSNDPFKGTSIEGKD
jgi:hypothetical protein